MNSNGNGHTMLAMTVYLLINILCIPMDTKILVRIFPAYIYVGIQYLKMPAHRAAKYVGYARAVN